MAADPQSEFERIFGKTQKANDANAESPRPGGTQKLPSDSDLLGIRTDSDRFLVKNVPETLEGAAKPPVQSAKKPDNPKAAQDAMTIALNVNVFANIADAKKADTVVGQEHEQLSGKLSELVGKKLAGAPSASADGPTFVIPIRRDAASGDVGKTPPAGNEFTRVLNPQNAQPDQSSNTEFTRVLHVTEKVQVPKPGSPPSANLPAATVATTPDAKPPVAVPEPAVVSRPGPSDYTKVVKGSELRTLQEKLAAAHAALNGPQAPSAAYPAQAWQPGSPAPLPHYVPVPANAWQSPAIPQASAPHPSKLSQYMPLVIVLNLLVLLAILLIVFFALKK